jgi:hypothetical protein
MLAAVENEQDFAPAQEPAQRSQHVGRERGKPDGGRDSARNQAEVLERREVDQPDAIVEAIDHLLGDGKGHRRLSDAARADDRHDPDVIQLALDGGDRIRAPDDARRNGGKVVLARRQRISIER